MRFWNTTRQWKRSADQAIAPAHTERQRELLAAEVCQRILAIRGAQGEGEQATSAVRQAALQALDEAVVRASLGLRYLDALDESLRQASYEDASRLLAEAQWARDYMEATASCRLNAAITAQGGDRFWEPNGRLERLLQTLAMLTLAELTAGEIAA